MTQQTVSMPANAQAQLRQGRIVRGVRSVIRHLVLTLLAGIWLVPIVWLVATSFSTDRGINVRRFFPAGYTLDNYANIMFRPDSVAQFPRWFTNTFVVACFTCVISTVARREAGRPRVQRAVTVLLSGMCLFDAVWLLSFGSLLWLGSVLLWAGTRLLQKLGCRAT